MRQNIAILFRLEMKNSDGICVDCDVVLILLI